MEKMIVVEAQKCSGCRMCEMVCSVKHDGASNPARARIGIVKWEEDGYYLPMVCQQCEDAPCAAVCPVKAITRDKELGRAVVDYDKCIGCKLCVSICPFGGMGYDVIGRRVINCDLCGGDPVCVKFCDPGALQFIDVNKANMKKKREAGKNLSELMKKHA
jgi:Fe-S-cluster-containing hydrogenase component 2